jgi:hypothetical protein
MPRWLPVVAVVSVALLLGVAARQVFYLPGNPRITEANFERIKPGMSRAEVEAILGPPGDYRTQPVSPDFLSIPHKLSRPRHGVFWHSDEVEISVEFDLDDDVVIDGRIRPMDRTGVGLANTLHWRCDRWWERHSR